MMVLPTKSDILSCNLSPRGDGNSIRPRDVHGYAMLQFIPARGRKHFLQRFNKCAAVSGLQFIPARGRKQPRRPVKTANLPRCNLSPRGDGNHAHDVVPYAVVRCNLSPRGDGNQLSIREWWEVGKIVAIYPREGTETISKSHIASPLWLQFIPARGRKPTHQHHWFCRHPPVAIYPREGTETCSHQRARSIPDCCNLSPRGDGNGHGGLIGCIGHRCNLSPRGDGNVERQRFSHDFRVAIYPREGTETSVVSWTYTAFWVAIYPREGTETFPCWLISCWKWLQFIPARGRKLRHYFSCDN